MGEALRSDQSDPGAHSLQGGHQRESKQGHPEKPKTKTRSRLGISGNAGRVIITGACNQSGSQNFQEFLQLSFFLHKNHPRRTRGSFKIQIL